MNKSAKQVSEMSSSSRAIELDERSLDEVSGGMVQDPYRMPDIGDDGSWRHPYLDSILF